MKSAQKILQKKWPFVTIDKALDAYRDKIMFPDKLEKANKVLKTAQIPPNKNTR